VASSSAVAAATAVAVDDGPSARVGVTAGIPVPLVVVDVDTTPVGRVAEDVAETAAEAEGTVPRKDMSDEVRSTDAGLRTDCILMSSITINTNDVTSKPLTARIAA
jgi:hypothetical protein